MGVILLFVSLSPALDGCGEEERAPYTRIERNILRGDDLFRQHQYGRAAEDYERVLDIINDLAQREKESGKPDPEVIRWCGNRKSFVETKLKLSVAGAHIYEMDPAAVDRASF